MRTGAAGVGRRKEERIINLHKVQVCCTYACNIKVEEQYNFFVRLFSASAFCQIQYIRSKYRGVEGPLSPSLFNPDHPSRGGQDELFAGGHEEVPPGQFQTAGSAE